MENSLAQCQNGLNKILLYLEGAAEKPTFDEIQELKKQIAIARLHESKKVTPLSALQLPTKIENALLRAGFQKVEDIQDFTESRLASIKRLGPWGARATFNALQEQKKLLS